MMSSAPPSPHWPAGPGTPRVSTAISLAFHPPREMAARLLSATGRSASVPRPFLWLLDFLVMAAAFFVAHSTIPLFRWLVGPGAPLRLPWLEWLQLPNPIEMTDWKPLSEIGWMFAVMGPPTLLFVQLLGGYKPILEQSRMRTIVASLLGPFAGLAAVVLVLFAVKYHHHTSRLLMFSFVLLSASGFLIHRSIIRAYKRRRLEAGSYTHNVVLLGRSSRLERLADYFEQEVPKTEYRVTGYLSPDPYDVDPVITNRGTTSEGQLVRLGVASELADLLIHQPIHEVVVVLSDGPTEWLHAVVNACDYFGVTLRMVPDALLTSPVQDALLPSGPRRRSLPEIVFVPRHLDSDARFVKRMLDIVVSVAALVTLSPVFAAIAIGIKLTTPQLPVFYPWRVVGYKGRRFTGYKFTTMAADADLKKSDLQHLNEMSGPVFKIKRDPRVTRFGRVLRKFSLNELPQFWSVLKGDMSLVGPRPAGPHELLRYELWHKRKLCVQPGITCLWQVRGRNQISNFDDWVHMDLEYIDNWSLWLDVKILWRTIWVVAAGTGS